MLGFLYIHVCAGWEPRLPRRHKVKGQPSSSHIYPGTISDSHSDSDSNKASSISSDVSHHSHGTPSPPPDEEGTVLFTVASVCHAVACSHSVSYNEFP